MWGIREREGDCKVLGLGSRKNGVVVTQVEKMGRNRFCECMRWTCEGHLHVHVEMSHRWLDVQI